MKQKSKKLATVALGRPWTEELDVREEQHSVEVEKSQGRRDFTNIAVCSCMLMLLCALAVYAMVTRNESLISQVFGLVKIGLIYVGAWAGGSAALQLFSKIDFSGLSKR